MGTGAAKEQGSWDLERLLRSPAWRGFFCAGLVVAVAAINAKQLHEISQARRMEVAWSAIFLQQLALWGAWGLAGWPLFRAALWMRRRSGSWLLFFALQAPLAAGVALGFAHLQDELQQLLGEPMRGARFGPGPREELTERGEEGAPESVERAGARRAGRPGPRSPGASSERARVFFLSRARTNFGVYWIVLGIGAVVTSFLQARDRERAAATSSLRASRLEAELARAQLGSLRDQLRPHFLFNALHTVGALVQQEKGAEAMRVIVSLGDLLRSILDYGDRQEVSLREELEVAQSYLGVERVRLGERLAVELEVEPGCMEARVPPLLLQPLLENALRHAIAPRTEGGRIRIAARRAGDRLVVRVEDDGPGFPAHVLDEAGGRAEARRRRSIGLANARERLRLSYGERQAFELSNPPAGGARVEVRIPFRSSDEPAEEPRAEARRG